MRLAGIVLAAFALGACALQPAAPDYTPLLADGLFGPLPALPQPAAALDASPAMRAYLAREVVPRVAVRGERQALLDALREDIRLEYDASTTRTAAEAFAARSGNCLSLVLMAAALARELDIPVRYQSVQGVDTWERLDGFAFRSGHVNLVLGTPLRNGWTVLRGDPDRVIDFMPSPQAAQLPARPILEATVLSMYYNNRAAETMAQGDLRGAYWWVRAAIRADPQYAPPYNTLGVVYLRRGALPLAERALAHVLQQHPDSVEVLGNLAEVVARQGRTAEADALRERRAELAPHPPFHFLDQGKAALARGDARQALALFRKELSRMPYDDEAHYGIALAQLRLGQVAAARQSLARAMENSARRERHALYAAKLEHLRGAHGSP